MLVDWYAESFRLTVFVGPNWNRRPLFQELVGLAPQELSENVPLQQRQEAGIISGAQARVMQQPGRIDVLLSDIPTRNTINPAASDYKKFFWIDKLEPGVDLFDQITKNVGVIGAAAQRIAYVPTLLWPCDSTKIAMSTLQKMLPLVQFNPDIDTDLVWYINRPRDVEGIGTINRYSKWNIVQAGFLMLGAERPSPPPTEFAARVELDINTSATNEEVRSNEILKMVQLLRSLALEIAEKGDRP
jgi:hypothetical protein